MNKEQLKGNKGPGTHKNEGKLSEWFMVLVLKTNAGNRRGFESLTFRSNRKKGLVLVRNSVLFGLLFHKSGVYSK